MDSESEIMKPVIDVNTGEVKATKKNVVLKSRAIGSCIAVAAYDKNEKVGALAHVMLPGEAPEGITFNKYRYAYNAIGKMIDLMIFNGAKKENIEVCLTGGGNILRRIDDTIGFENIKSVIETLHKEKISIKVKSVAGFVRRGISLDVETGNVYLSVGDEQEKLLWKFE